MIVACDLTERLYSIGNAYRQAKVLLSAVELDVFSVLAKGPLDAAALAGRLDIDRRGARDFFDALVALGLLDRGTDGRYQNTEATNLYLDRAKPTYLGGSFDQYNRREYEMWGLLTEALRTGRPRTEINGHDHFQSIYHDPIRFRSFVNAMTVGSMLSARCIAEQFPWKKYRTLCDVGTAQGCFPVQIALAQRSTPLYVCGLAHHSLPSATLKSRDVEVRAACQRCSHQPRRRCADAGFAQSPPCASAIVRSSPTTHRVAVLNCRRSPSGA